MNITYECHKCAETKNESRFIFLSDCSHNYCKKCYKKDWDKKISEKNYKNFHCLKTNCFNPISSSILKIYLSDSDFYIYSLHCQYCETIFSEIELIILKCDHKVCKKCFNKYIKIELKQSKTKIKCPLINCKIKISSRRLKKYLSEELLLIYYSLKDNDDMKFKENYKINNDDFGEENFLNEKKKKKIEKNEKKLNEEILPKEKEQKKKKKLEENFDEIDLNDKQIIQKKEKNEKEKDKKIIDYKKIDEIDILSENSNAFLDDSEDEQIFPKKEEEEKNLNSQNKKKCKLCNEDKNSNDIIYIDCGHFFCSKCFKSKWNTTLLDPVTFLLKCPEKNCNKELDLPFFQKYLTKNEFESYSDFLAQIISENIKGKNEIISNEKQINSVEKCKICNKNSNDFIYLECQHFFCSYCLKKDWDLKLITLPMKSPIICPDKKCNREIEISFLKHYFTKEQYLIYNDYLLKNEKCKNIKEDKIIYEQYCNICLHNKKIDDMITLDCDHFFCSVCLLNDWNLKLEKKIFGPLICPQENCKKKINETYLQRYLSKENFQKYNDFLFSEFFENNNSDEKMINCPKCNQYVLIQKNDKNFKCQKCNESFCAKINCRISWNFHKHSNCEQANKLANPDKNDFFNKLKNEKGWKDCPKCSITIEKTKNCNYIRCESEICKKKTLFCYLCGCLLEEDSYKNHFIDDQEYNTCKNYANNLFFENEEEKVEEIINIFICDHCNKTFYNKANLNKHLKKLNKSRDQNNIKKKNNKKKKKKNKK